MMMSKKSKMAESEGVKQNNEIAQIGSKVFVFTAPHFGTNVDAIQKQGISVDSCTCLIVYFMPMYCLVNIMFLRAVLITDNLVCLASLFIPLKVGCFGTGMEQHLTWVLL
jgi:hypothetical protein